MKKKSLATMLVALSLLVHGQDKVTKPDLIKINDPGTWTLYNRQADTVTKENEKIAVLDARESDGLAVYNDLEFGDGTIEIDLKGKDVLQRSFLGIAFHIQDENTFNAIYFRPFNFKSEDPARRGHAVQYISHPEFTWRKLRTEFPEQFENPVDPVPDPDQFFHARIEVRWPDVKVFVEDAVNPSLSVKMKSNFKKGKVGLWVGFGSDGTFKNLVISR